MPTEVGPDTYDPSTPIGVVRMLILDTNMASPVFPDAEIQAFLTLEGNSVKLAAAQALDTIANDEALTSKVIRTQDLQTDGAKLADSLRKGAASLRAQVAEQVALDDEGYFEVIDINGPECGVPELTQRPFGWPSW